MNDFGKKANQDRPPSGMKYMKYCEGGFSDNVVKIGENGCLADYPGDLAKEVFLISFISTFIFLGVFYYYLKRRKRLRTFAK